MWIRRASWSLAIAAAFFTAAPGHAQNLTGFASAPPFALGVQPAFATPLGPLGLALPPVTTTPVPAFAQSPVGPYGRPATPIITPSAPVVARRPNSLLPNGVLLSNGAVVEPGLLFAPVIPPASAPSLGIPDIPRPVLITPANGVAARDRAARSAQARQGVNSNNATGRQRRADNATLPAAVNAPIAIPTAPVATGARNAAERAAARAAATSASSVAVANSILDANGALLAGVSVQSLIDAFGNPTMSVYQDDGQILSFDGGIQAFIRNGVTQ